MICRKWCGGKSTLTAHSPLGPRSDGWLSPDGKAPPREIDERRTSTCRVDIGDAAFLIVPSTVDFSGEMADG